MKTHAEVNFYCRVGERIRATREAAGVSRAKLGAEAGLSVGTVGKVEDDGAMSLWVIARIAEALDVTIDELVPIGAEVERG